MKKSINRTEISKVYVSEVSRLLNLDPIGPDFKIKGASSIDRPNDCTVMFCNVFDHEICDRIKELNKALVIYKHAKCALIENITFLNVSNPRFTYAEILTSLQIENPKSEPRFNNLSNNSSYGDRLHLGSFITVEDGVEIGNNVRIGNGCSILSGTIIGDNSSIAENCVIGGDGFGFAKDVEKGVLHIPHIGGVTIANDVYIGPNSVICRGTIDPTFIGEFTKIDGAVWVGHNVIVEPYCMVPAGAVLCGSVKIGKDSWIGANASIIESTSIGERALIGIGSVVTNDVLDSEKYMGFSAMKLSNLAKIRRFFKSLI